MEWLCHNGTHETPGERLKLDDDTLQLLFPREPGFPGVLLRSAALAGEVHRKSSPHPGLTSPLPVSRSLQLCLPVSLLSPLERIHFIKCFILHRGMTGPSAGLFFCFVLFFKYQICTDPNCASSLPSSIGPAPAPKYPPLGCPDPPVLPQSSHWWPWFSQILGCHQEQFHAVQPPPWALEPPSWQRWTFGFFGLSSC